MEYKKVTVLGSNSFSGSHFVDYVLDNTDAEVIGISRSPEYEPIFLPYLYKKSEKPTRFKFSQLDLNKNLEEIINLLDKEKPEIIVNFSSQGEVRNSWKWPEQWYQTNCLSLVNLTNQLKDRNYIKRFIHISTPEVYGSTDENMKETMEFNPSTPYASSRLAGESFLRVLHKRYGFPVIFTRAANVHGIHQQLFRIIPKSIISFKKDRIIELHGKGKTRRGFVHIKDVVDATWKAALFGKNGETYHFSVPRETITMYDLVKIVAGITKHDFNEHIKLVEENFGQDELYSLDPTKAMRELEWNPRYTLEDGIKETLSWINENWEKIRALTEEYVHKK